MTKSEFEHRRILVVDDNESIHRDFHKILSARPDTSSSLASAEEALFGSAEPESTIDLPSFEIDSAYQGQDALVMAQEAVAQGRPYAVAFVDVRMPPGWDGIETSERLWELDSNLQIVLCTAYSDYSMREMLFRLGQSDNLLILKKPFDVCEAHLMAITLSEKWRMTRESNDLIRNQSDYITDISQVMAIIQSCNSELETAHTDLSGHADILAQRLQQRTVEVLGMRDVTVFALAQLVESRDLETGEHLCRMQAYSQILAKHLANHGPYLNEIDDEFLQDFYQSTPLHDIGKVGIPDAILLKPGRLTPAEFEVMKQHTVVGAEALEKTAAHSPHGGFLTMAAQIARNHHEKFDGTGYPDGLIGGEIPLSARIVAIADVFDALTSQRVYKEAMDPDDARAEINAARGQHFDPVVVDAFNVCFEDFLQSRKKIDGAREANNAYANSLA